VVSFGVGAELTFESSLGDVLLQFAPISFDAFDVRVWSAL